MQHFLEEENLEHIINPFGYTEKITNDLQYLRLRTFTDRSPAILYLSTCYY